MGMILHVFLRICPVALQFLHLIIWCDLIQVFVHFFLSGDWSLVYSCHWSIRVIISSKWLFLCIWRVPSKWKANNYFVLLITQIELLCFMHFLVACLVLFPLDWFNCAASCSSTNVSPVSRENLNWLCCFHLQCKFILLISRCLISVFICALISFFHCLIASLTFAWICIYQRPLSIDFVSSCLPKSQWSLSLILECFFSRVQSCLYNFASSIFGSSPSPLRDWHLLHLCLKFWFLSACFDWFSAFSYILILSAFLCTMQCILCISSSFCYESFVPSLRTPAFHSVPQSSTEILHKYSHAAYEFQGSDPSPSVLLPSCGLWARMNHQPFTEASDFPASIIATQFAFCFFGTPSRGWLPSKLCAESSHIQYCSYHHWFADIPALWTNI